MTEAHWFALHCPFFSVFDLEKYAQVYSLNYTVSEEALTHAGLLKAAAWLSRHREKWHGLRARYEAALERSAVTNTHICQWAAPCYPQNLKHLYLPPPILFVSGRHESLNGPLLSVVGARHPTELGRLWVQRVLPLVCRRGVCIVSGGARGIDAEAHQAALDGGGATVAFLPGAVDKPYPYGNRYLFDRIKNTGALVSEFPPDTEVRPENFHRRNRLIAGVAQFVLVVEAGIESGTIMTANRAIVENREVLVVPGPPFVASYAGSLALLAQGATMVRDEKDVIAQLVEKNVLK